MRAPSSFLPNFQTRSKPKTEDSCASSEENSPAIYCWDQAHRLTPESRRDERAMKTPEHSLFLGAFCGTKFPRLKTPQGYLLITTNLPEIFFLFFGGEAFARSHHDNNRPPTTSAEHESSTEHSERLKRRRRQDSRKFGPPLFRP